MAINDLQISFPDFKLLETIDPEQFDANNADIKSKINEIVRFLNTLESSIVNGNSGADHVAITKVEGVNSLKVQGALEEISSDVTNRTPLTGDHKGTWQGMTPREASESVNASRLDKLEEPKTFINADKTTSMIIPSGVQTNISPGNNTWRDEKKEWSNEHHRWTPSKSGVYVINWHVRFKSDSVPTGDLNMAIYEDSIQRRNMIANRGSAFGNVSWIIDAKANKSYTFWLTQNSSSGSKILDYSNVYITEISSGAENI